MAAAVAASATPAASGTAMMVAATTPVVVATAAVTAAPAMAAATLVGLRNGEDCVAVCCTSQDTEKTNRAPENKRLDDSLYRPVLVPAATTC
uniref:Uncharacterized protein n=1 Tax=Oryza brachyantha TaxID=4533 RepID=J3MXU9_ORYBR